MDRVPICRGAWRRTHQQPADRQRDAVGNPRVAQESRREARHDPDRGRAAQAEMMRAEARLAEAQAKKMTIDLKLQSARAKFGELIINAKPCLKFLKVDLC